MMYMRTTVDVKFRDNFVNLQHAFWSLQLPRDWVAEIAGLEQFLRGSLPISNVNIDNPKTINVLNILQLAGCLTIEKKELFTLREVRELFESICLTWHGHYYKHPLWAKLRQGQLSHNALLAWVIHNYHLSRSAGVTAARCAVSSENRKIRKLFLESSLEEYSHCQDYFLINDPRLHITEQQALSYLPLRASLAFDQQMLRLAEEDWLAHIFVGYLQESTANFYKQCCDFYQEVEKGYSLDGFFDGWKGHIRLDIDYGHASAFAEALDTEGVVNSSHLEISLRNAAITLQFLVQALDEIMLCEKEDETISLRGSITPSSESLINNPVVTNYNVAFENWSLDTCTTISDLFVVMEKTKILYLEPTKDIHLSSVELEFLECEIATALCRGLSYAQTHTETIKIGRLVEFAAKQVERKIVAEVWSVPNAWVAGLANFIREVSTRPPELVLLIRHIHTCFQQINQPVTFIASDATIEAINDLCAFYQLSKPQLASMATLILQFNELWSAVHYESTLSLDTDIFH